METFLKIVTFLLIASIGFAYLDLAKKTRYGKFYGSFKLHFFVMALSSLGLFILYVLDLFSKDFR